MCILFPAVYMQLMHSLFYSLFSLSLFFPIYFVFICPFFYSALFIIYPLRQYLRTRSFHTKLEAMREDYNRICAPFQKWFVALSRGLERCHEVGVKVNRRSRVPVCRFFTTSQAKTGAITSFSAYCLYI